MLIFLGRIKPGLFFISVKFDASITRYTSAVASMSLNARSAHIRVSRLHAFPGLGIASRVLVAVTAVADILKNKRSVFSVKSTEGKVKSSELGLNSTEITKVIESNNH